MRKTKPELRLVNDQRGAPSSSANIATATLRMLDAWQQSSAARQKEFVGLYHATSAGETSWFEFAAEIFHNRASGTVPTLSPISSEQYTSAARRPRNSVLDCGKLKRTFGMEMIGESRF